MEKSQGSSMKLLLKQGTRIKGNPPTREVAPDCFTESTPNLQANRALHSTQVPYQPGLQHHQGLTMGQVLETNPVDLTSLKLEEYCSYHDSKGYNTIYCWSLWKYLEELIHLGFIKEYIFTPEAASRLGQTNAPPAQPQHMITQYKAIEWSCISNKNMAVSPPHFPIVFRLYSMCLFQL